MVTTLEWKRKDEAAREARIRRYEDAYRDLLIRADRAGRQGLVDASRALQAQAECNLQLVVILTREEG